MKIAQINMFDYGSTGKIMLGISEVAKESGYQSLTLSTLTYTKGSPDKKREIYGHKYFGYLWENKAHVYLGILTGLNGRFSYFGTRQLIKILKKYNPDVIHLHNIHKFCINIPMLFKYLKKCGKKVVWTLHDCWAFTGHCPNFDMIGCEKWKTGCYDCPQIRAYPKSLVDNSKSYYKNKKKWFSGVDNMTLVTPSKWLAGLVKQSFLKDYAVKVINNGINLSVFKPTENDFKKQYGIEDKFLILGVAFGWSERKGLDVFNRLAEDLSSDYAIVLVGVSKDEKKNVSDKIITVERTQNAEELAKIYSASDLFVNPTREENFPTVNIESLACGTPIVTFNTGGSPEIIDLLTGICVEKDDYQALMASIKHIKENAPIKSEDCIERAKIFNEKEKYKEYIALYKGTES